MSQLVCVCVCVCVKERERERERDTRSVLNLTKPSFGNIQKLWDTS